MSESSGKSTCRAVLGSSHRDAAWARGLHRASATYRVPSRVVGAGTARAKPVSDPLQAVARARLPPALLTASRARQRELRAKALKSLQAAPVSDAAPDRSALEVEAMRPLGEAASARPLIGQLCNDGNRDPGFASTLQRGHIAYPVNGAFGARLAAATAQAADPVMRPKTADVARRRGRSHER